MAEKVSKNSKKAAAGKKGGETTLKKIGPEGFAEIGRKGRRQVHGEKGRLRQLAENALKEGRAPDEVVDLICAATSHENRISELISELQLPPRKRGRRPQSKEL